MAAGGRARGVLGLVAGVVATLGAAGAAAQEQDDLRHDGTWTASTRCGAVACEVRVVLAEFGGTWQDVSRRPARQRQCAGKAMPLTVQRSDASQLVFTVWGSGVAAGCPDLTVRTTPDGPRTLAGTVQRGLHGAEGTVQGAAGAASAASAAASDPSMRTDAAAPITLQRRGNR